MILVEYFSSIFKALGLTPSARIHIHAHAYTRVSELCVLLAIENDQKASFCGAAMGQVEGGDSFCSQ